MFHVSTTCRGLCCYNKAKKHFGVIKYIHNDEVVYNSWDEFGDMEGEYERGSWCGEEPPDSTWSPTEFRCPLEDIEIWDRSE